jgi:hypothetical protein
MTGYSLTAITFSGFTVGVGDGDELLGEGGVEEVAVGDGLVVEQAVNTRARTATRMITVVKLRFTINKLLS